MRTLLAFASLAAVSVIPSEMWAQNAHFVGNAKVSGISSNGTISVSFKEAGLGNDETVFYSFAGNYVADYGCINLGGNHPQASNKTAQTGTLSVSGSFSSGQNGTISGTLSFTPPDASGILSCPGTQVAALVDITYSNLSLRDTSNNIPATLSTTGVSATFYHFKH